MEMGIERRHRWKKKESAGRRSYRGRVDRGKQETGLTSRSPVRLSDHSEHHRQR